MRISKKHICLHQISIVLLIVANICFYNLETMRLYLVLCAGAIMLSVVATAFGNKFRFLRDKGVGYLTLLYVMYAIYGTLFLRAGEYNWDFLAFSYTQGVCFYLSCRYLFSFPDWYKKTAIAFILGGLIAVLYIFFAQRELILVNQVEVRIGEGMSGNVNTVGVSLGIISFVITFFYCVSKKKWIIPVLISILLMMLLTGSKKTIIIILIDILTLYFYEGARGSSYFKLGILLVVLGWIIFEVPYLYEILGKRVTDMFSTISGSGMGDYSHSTDARAGMIREAVKIGMNHPVFGGGMNCFAAESIYYGYYGYSHCNYTELLCNFGMVGMLLYYIPYFSNISFLWKIRRSEWQKSVFGSMWLVMSLALGWSMVAFSGTCINYLPIVASYALMESIKCKQND